MTGQDSSSAKQNLVAQLGENIWFTRKARITAETRLLNYHFHAQIIFVYYSLINVSLAVSDIAGRKMLGDNTGLALVIMSISLLVISLLISAFNFQGRALQMKNNYLKLHKLNDRVNASNGSDFEELSNSYNELLNESENHKEYDDLLFRVRQKMTLTSRKPSNSDSFKILGIRFLRFTFFAIVYFGPTLLIYMSQA